jgi:hypothetical protein
MACALGRFADARRRVREWQRAKTRYAEDPEYRERKLAIARTFREAHKEELAAERKLRFATDPEYREKVQAAGRRWLLKGYGLTPEAFAAMVARQNGSCFLCLQRPATGLHVDHNHKTKRVRRLLCFQCNSGLGQFNDDPALLRKAADYVETDGFADDPE